MKRHNEANGENNRDGHQSNYSDNFGVEGTSDDTVIVEARRQRVRNILATVLLSQGTPMILAGDEGGNSQDGNNNAYCQDNATSWIDWQSLDDGLIEFTSALSGFRRRHAAVRQNSFLHGMSRTTDGRPDVEWRDFDGSALNWRDPGLSSLCLLLRGCAECSAGLQSEDEVLLAFNRKPRDLELVLPDSGSGQWIWEINSSSDIQVAEPVTGASVLVAPQSVAAFTLRSHEGA